MMKKIGEFIFGAVVCAIAAFGVVHIVMGCGSLPVGHRAVITERANVQPGAFLPDADGQAHAFPAPVETLSGAIGNTVRQKFAGKEAILTTEDQLVPNLVPGSTELVFDVPSLRSLMNPSTSDLVTSLAGKVLPAAAAPWVGPLACFLPLLIPNFRKNATVAVQRVIPGIPSPDPTEQGTLPGVSDFQKAVLDLARAITLHPPDPATLATTTTTVGNYAVVPPPNKPLNG